MEEPRWTKACGACGFLFVTITLVNGQRVFASNLVVPSQYPNIQAAIDAASDNDVIHVEAGVYKGAGNTEINIRRAVTVTGSPNPADCIIDLEGKGRAFNLNHDEGVFSLSRFTIRNGSSFKGGAIFASGSA